jgi:antirestriction protein ArdC
MAAKKKWEKRKEKAETMLREGVAELISGDDMLRRWMEFRARFHQYSFRNALLIRMQLETARHVMGYSKWQKNGRQVKKGEKGLLIFTPWMKTAKTQEEADDNGVNVGDKYLAGFGTGKVFDFSQTKPITEEMKADLQASFKKRGFSQKKINAVKTAKEAGTETLPNPVPELEGDDFKHLYSDLVAAAKAEGYTVEMLPETAAQNGDCLPEKKRIRIREDLSANQMAKTMAHEFAHGYAHDQATRRELGARRVELQAEGAAFMTCYMLGLDTSEYSFRYLANWSPADIDDEDALVTSVEAEIKAIEKIADYLTERVADCREARELEADMSGDEGRKDEEREDGEREDAQGLDRYQRELAGALPDALR